MNTGNSFFIVPVVDAGVLGRIVPDFASISRLSEEFDAIGCYVFTTDAGTRDRDATARMFAPRYGIEEEAGTGMAAGPLACYLHDKLGLRRRRLLIQQGRFMDPPSVSLIVVDLAVGKDDRITGLMAGGNGLAVGTKRVELSA